MINVRWSNFANRIEKQIFFLRMIEMDVRDAWRKIYFRQSIAL